MNDQLLTLQQVAEYLKVSPKTVRRLVAGGRIPCVRVGRLVRFERRDLSRWIEGRKE